MSKEILVSIVINNYNYGRFLRQAIASALRQTHEPFEVIVVDDGSTDSSREIINEYGNLIIPVFKENGGQASAFNAGFARSHGELVIFLDADDILHASTAHKVAAIFRDDPALARIHYRLEVIDASGQSAGKFVPPAYLPLASGDLRRRASALVNGANWAPTSGNAFSAWALRELLPMPEVDFRTCADYYLLRANALCGPLVALDEVGAYYRHHHDNTYMVHELKLEQIHRQIALTQDTCRHVQHFIDAIANNAPGEKPGSLPGARGAQIEMIAAANAQRANTRQEEVKGYRHIVEIYDEIHLAQRMASIRLDREAHPVTGDSAFSLFWRGARAAVKRSDLAPLLKLAHVSWFALMLLAPRRLAQRISQRLTPAGRASTNPLFKVLQALR